MSEFYCGCLVTKHSWKGKYKRLLCVTSTHLNTYNPNTLELTNSWPMEDIASVYVNPKVPGSDEFCVSFKKSKILTFSTSHYETVISELLRNKRKFCQQNSEVADIKFQGSKVLRSGNSVPVVLMVSSCGLEQWSVALKRRIAIYFYKDIEFIIPLKNRETGFVIQHSVTKRKRAFLVKNYNQLVSRMSTLSLQYLGHRINFQTEGLSLEELQDVKFGVFSDDESMRVCAQFPVTKLTIRSGNNIPRIFSISENCFIEHDPDTYRPVTVKPLNTIWRIIRCIDNPQMFGIELITSRLDSTLYYCCAERDVLLSTLIDVIRMNCSPDIYIQCTNMKNVPRFYIPGHAIDETIEMLHLKMLTEQENKIESIIRFNNNIPYNGIVNAEDSQDSIIFRDKKQRLVVSALTSILSLSNIERYSNAEMEQYLQCLRRLFATKYGYQSFTTNPLYMKSLGGCIVKALKRENDDVSYAAIEMLNSLLHPMHNNYELYYEQQNKLSLLSSITFIKNIFTTLKMHIERGTGALIISSILDFITFVICQPYSDTTEGSQFDKLITELVSIGRTLFKLFSHPSGSIVKSAGLIMQAIINEADPDIVLKMQHFALSEGIYTRYLLSALFTDPSDTRQMINRQLSRRLLALWLQDSSYGRLLLKRTLPLGLVDFLDSEEAASEALELDAFRDTLSVASAVIKGGVEAKLKFALDQTERFLKHWHVRISHRMGKEVKQQQTDKDKERVLTLRNPRNRVVITLNWNLFYQKFYQDHYIPELIWNHKTREELKESLEAELRGFSVDKDLSRNELISWNFDEYMVSYGSLQDQLIIGNLYVRPLLENNQVTTINDPTPFFYSLYHSYLQVANADLKMICLQALTKLYRHNHETIGEFNDLRYIVDQLARTASKVLRDRLVMLLAELLREKSNVRKFIEYGGLSMLVDFATLAHLHSSRARVPLQNNMIVGGVNLESESDIYKEWYVMSKGEGGGGKSSSNAHTLAELKQLYQSGSINENTKVWAQGMEGWKSLKTVTQLKWTLVSTDEAVLDDTELAVKVLDTLNVVVRFYPSVDVDGGIIRPMPKVKRLLSDIRCLPHLCQLLLTFEPRIVEKVCSLLYEVMLENAVINQLFLTGFFYFVMMYTGSNITPVAKFLKYTHTKQAHSLANFTENTIQNSIAQLSILNSILPDSLICYLYNYDVEKFSEAFLSDFENPEIIWSNEMRRHMIERIALHLADFTSKLKSNVRSLYIYCPMPVIEYQALKDEIFCGSYYLSRLCDEQNFPNWPIADPLKVLRDILEAWKFEVNKQPPKFSVNDALTTLGLEPGVEHDNAALRRAYFKLATKYHPDKNPDGRDIFEAVVSAYEYLCSRDFISSTPQTHNIILILKSQSILFKRCTEQLKPYKYSGYPMLIHTLRTETSKDDTWTQKQDNLVLPATELCHYSIACSVLNAEELRREGGIEILKDIMNHCAREMSQISTPTDSIVQVCTSIIQCFTASAMFEGFRTIIFELPGYVQNLCQLLMYHETLTGLAGKVCECVITLVVDDMIQLRLLEMGIMYHLVLFLFTYDYTLSESGIATTSKNNTQMLFNELASLSMQTLSIMDLTSVESGGVHIVIHNLILRLLTYHVVHSLKSCPTHEILKLINTNHETPYYVWNNSTRKQLIDFVSQARIPNPDNERLNYEIASTFRYKEHENLLFVGNVYVNIYNKNPDFTLYNKEEFIISLLSYIEMEVKQSTEPKDAPTSQTQTQIQTQTSKDDLLTFDDKWTADGTTARLACDVEMSQELCDNFGQCLKAITNLLKYNTGIETLCNDYWKSLFLCLGLAKHPALQKETLEIIHNSIKNLKCVESLENCETMGYLLPMLAYFPECHPVLFDCFEALFTKIKLVKECMNKGILLYLLDIFCQSTDPGVRCRTASLFARLINDKLNGPRIRIILLKFLPHIFLDAIMDDVEASVLLFESNQENPELIWNDDIRKHVSVTVSNMCNQFCRQQKRNPDSILRIDDDFSCFTDFYTQNGRDIIVNGVYLQLFIAQPGWVLRRPKEFLISLLDKIVSYYSLENLTEDEVKCLQVCSKAFVCFVTAQNHVADSIPQLGHLTVFVSSLRSAIDANNVSIAASCVKVIHAVVKNSYCCKCMIQYGGLIGCIIAAFKITPDLSEQLAETLSFIFSHKFNEYIILVLNQNLLKDIVQLLETRFDAEDKKVTTASRAHIARALQYMCEDEVYGSQIASELDNFPIWKQYKSQRHDLFIDEPSLIHKVGYTASGIAGYLTAAHNTKPNTITNHSHNLLLTQTEPPPPPEMNDEDDE